VAASACQIEVSGAAFVPICLKAHGSGPPRACWAFIQSAAAKIVPQRTTGAVFFSSAQGAHQRAHDAQNAVLSWQSWALMLIPLCCTEAAAERAEQLRPLFTELAGMSHRKVAAELNARKIPTPAGGQWHAVTVKRVLSAWADVGCDKL
jgi:hypothetical protein